MPKHADGALRASLALPTGDRKTSAILLEKSAPREVRAGVDFEYELQVTNLTQSILSRVTVSESLPAGLVIQGSDPEPTRSVGGELEWALGELEPQGSRQIVVRGSADAVGLLTTYSNVTYATGVQLALNVISPSLTLVASGPSSGTPCDELAYRYLVSNTGSGSIANIVVAAALPPGLTTLAGSHSIHEPIGDLAAGESRELIIKAKAAKPGTLVHRATAQADGGLSAASQSLSTAISQPALRLAMTGPERAYSGRSVDYELTVTNTGGSAARNVQVAASLPPAATFRSATGNGRRTGDRVHWALGDLEPGAAHTVAVKLAGANGRLVVGGTALAHCAEDASSSATTEVTGIPAIRLEVIDQSGMVEVGDTETYVVTVTNQGTADDTDVRIVCEIPDNTSLISASGATRAAPSGGTIEFDPLERLGAGQAAEWRVVVRADEPADARFRVSLRSGHLKGTPVVVTEATTYYE